MILDDINEAIKTGATIEIEYTKGDGTSSIRKLSDVQFSEEYGDMYISAFCHMRQEQRTFKISRIKKVIFLSGGNADEEQSLQSVLINPTNSHVPYRFNANKRIYKLYGEDYNY